jgi:hypothetical protein
LTAIVGLRSFYKYIDDSPEEDYIGIRSKKGKVVIRMCDDYVDRTMGIEEFKRHIIDMCLAQQIYVIVLSGNPMTDSTVTSLTKKLILSARHLGRVFIVCDSYHHMKPWIRACVDRFIVSEDNDPKADPCYSDRQEMVYVDEKWSADNYRTRGPIGMWS